MKIGIVGLPNVGKSTLFNAFLGRQQALSANYPFATIEPNVGVVDVYDERVDILGRMSKSDKLVYSNITFVDIAGIVEGASKGEGLGNQFLANIREVDLILILIRAFNDDSIVREGSKDPESDYQIILTELILKDIESVILQDTRLKRNLTKEEVYFKSGLQKVRETLEKGEPAISSRLTDEENAEIKKLQLLTKKKFIRVHNISEKDLAKIRPNGSEICYVSAKIESELSNLSIEDQKLYLADLGLQESPLNILIKKCYDLLGYETFLTTGPQESRAWKFIKGMSAVECSGVIHTDFIKNFIKAEVIKYDDLVKLGSKAACRDSGKLRLEGKEYLFKDGDVVEFKIGA